MVMPADVRVHLIGTCEAARGESGYARGFLLLPRTAQGAQILIEPWALPPLPSSWAAPQSLHADGHGQGCAPRPDLDLSPLPGALPGPRAIAKDAVPETRPAEKGNKVTPSSVSQKGLVDSLALDFWVYYLMNPHFHS